MYLHINLEITLFRQTIKNFFFFLHLSSYKALFTGCWKLCLAKKMILIFKQDLLMMKTLQMNWFKSQFAALVWT